MNAEQLAPITAAVLILSVAAPAFAAVEDDGLSVGVSQNDDVVVTVTSNGTAVENASVSVNALNNSTYAGVGSYTTDVNGTVSLATPSNNTTVRIVATKGNVTDATTATLVAADEEESEEADSDSFGQQVSSFVYALLSGEDVKNPGHIISAWVTENNPGADKNSDVGEESNDKKPAHAEGPENGDDHPGNGHDKKGNDEDDEDDEDEAENDDHPGNGNGKKNGHGHGN